MFLNDLNLFAKTLVNKILLLYFNVAVQKCVFQSLGVAVNITYGRTYIESIDCYSQ